MKLTFTYKDEPLTDEAAKGLIVNGSWEGLLIYPLSGVPGLCVRSGEEAPPHAWVDMPEEAQAVLASLLGVGKDSLGALYYAAQGAVQEYALRIKEMEAELERSRIAQDWASVARQAACLEHFAKEAAKHQRQADRYQAYA